MYHPFPKMYSLIARPHIERRRLILFHANSLSLFIYLFSGPFQTEFYSMMVRDGTLLIKLDTRIIMFHKKPIGKAPYTHLAQLRHRQVNTGLCDLKSILRHI